MPADQP